MSELQTPASPSQPDIDVSQYQRVKSARELDLEAALVAARDVIASYKARWAVRCVVRGRQRERFLTGRQI